MPDMMKKTLDNIRQSHSSGTDGLAVKTQKHSILDEIAKKRWVIPLGLILLYLVSFSILFPSDFLNAYNLTAVLLEFSVPAILAVGMAVQLIGGEIDLSVGYAVMFSVTASGYFITKGYPIWAGILLPIAITCLVGLVVGLLVAKVGVNSFIATLGSGLVFYGLGLNFAEAGRKIVNADGVSVLHLPTEFTQIGQFPIFQFADGGQITLPIVYAVIIIVLFSLLMGGNPVFKKYYYIGMNKEAAKLSGISVTRMKVMQFVISAGLAGFGGVVLAARMGSASASLGIGMELNAITACVIGGISMWGGVGTMGGGVLGCLFMICLSNGLRIANVPSNIYTIIQGLVLLGAVITDSIFSRRKTVG